MFVSFSASSVLFKYLRKAFICLWLLGLLSCKDFKSWESIYDCEVKIKFESEKDEWAPQVLKNLQSAKTSKLLNESKLTAFLGNNKHIEISNNSLCIPLNPYADAVSFALSSLEDKGNSHYQTVTIYYQRRFSLISPEAGGLQVQYTVKDIKFSTTNNKNPFFKKFTIEDPIPLKEEKTKTHVTLYY